MSAMPETKSSAAPIPTPCAQYPLNFFFPDEARSGKPTDGELAALRVCARCPIADRRLCLERELRLPARKQHGVVGCTTAAQRRSIIRSRKADAKAEAAR